MEEWECSRRLCNYWYIYISCLSTHSGSPFPLNSLWVRYRQGRRPIRDSPLGTPAPNPPPLYPSKAPSLDIPCRSRFVIFEIAFWARVVAYLTLLQISRNPWKGSTRSPAVQGVMERTRIVYCIIARRMGRTSFRWLLLSEMDSRRVSGF